MNKEFYEIVEKVVKNNNYLLVDVIVRGSSKKPVFEIFIDSGEGVSAENCAGVSREINDLLESSSFANSDYRLEVSSPGIDKALKFLEQYPKHIGRKFKIEFEDNAETKSIDAVLEKIEGENLYFKLNSKEEFFINFNKIKKAKVLISF